MNHRTRVLAAAWAGCLLLCGSARAGEIVFETARMKLVLGEDARWRSLTDRPGGAERCHAPGKIAMASIVLPGSPARRAEACGAAYTPARSGSPADGGELVLRFAGCQTALTFAVAPGDDAVVFTLTGVAGPRPAEATLLRFCTTVREHVGPRLALGWDAQAGVGVMACNLQARAQAAARADHAELLAHTQDSPGPRLEGAAACLYAAPERDLDALLGRLSRRFDLPRNEQGATPSRLLPLARRSYWFLHIPQKDVQPVIELCRTSGIHQVMMLSGSWCRDVGHYTFHPALYPDGLAGLQEAVRKMHEAGILVGMHCYASKISKTDACVTPVPDRRFWVDRVSTLAGTIGPDETAIRAADDLREWPGSPVASQKLWEGGVDKHREVILDDEIVAYESIGPEGRWDTFLGCKRGAWKTVRAAHRAGTALRHYGVDGCINGYIIDQETGLLDEAAGRLGAIFNACGFDMVYFDGGEDVDRRRFDHYCTKFQAVAMSKFTRRPLVHMGTAMTHGLWHSFTRSGTVDTYMNTLNGHIQAGGRVETWPSVRDHIDRSVRYMLSIAEDRMVGELGWFGIWPKGKNTDGLQLDEIEYLMGKSLAYDAPISLQSSLAQMKSHPLTGGVLEIVRAYEELRSAGTVPQDVRQRLARQGKDFLLYRPARAGARAATTAPAAGELLEALPAQVAGGPEVRAMLARRGPDTVASVWHYAGQPVTLVLPPSARPAQVSDLGGQPLPAVDRERQTRVSLPPRRVNLLLPACSLEQARERLRAAHVEPPAPAAR